MDDDWYEEPSIFYGFGSMHDLRDAEHQPSRLAGLKSVKNTTTLQREPKAKSRPAGFRFPWRR